MNLTTSASPLIIALAALLLLAGGAVCWLNWHRRRGTGVAAMEALRFLILLLISFTLLKPEFVKKIIRTEPPEVIVLTDASGSMETRDVVLDPQTVIRRDEWLESRRRTNAWLPLSEAGRLKVTVEEFARPDPTAPVPTAGTNAASGGLTNQVEEGTDLNAALEAVLARQRNLRAVLLLSDGDWNLGRSPVGAATRYRAQGVPVYTVAIGSDTPLPDLELLPVNAPSFGLLGEQISIPFKIVSHLPREVRTTVSVTAPGGTVDVRREVVIPALGTVQDAVVWQPRGTGEFMLTMRVPVAAEELLPENNAQSFRINVRTEKLKVLVVESLPRWEYRYLRNALSRDPGVEVSCLLFHPEIGTGGGNNYINNFPVTREDLAKFDVIFLGDVGIGSGELTTENADNLKGVVEFQGSGLVFMPGPRGRELTLLKSPLADLLPVVPDEGKPEGVIAPNEASLTLTAAGQGHFLTLLTADERRNEQIWKNLPGFYWSAAVQKSRPGAEVLAVHSSLRNAAGRVPLLAIRPYGQGEVLFMGTDAAWRWRRGVEDRYHYRFWGQVVRWMAHKRHMARGEGLRLTHSPENPRAGESLFLQTAITDLSAFNQASPDTVTARIVSPGGRVERLEMTPVSGGWGVAQTTFVPREGGKYRITATTDRGGRKVEAEVNVVRPRREKVGQPANAAILREISELTLGRAGGVADLDQLVSAIRALPEPEPVVRRFRLWCDPWWAGSIVLLLSVYWIARKAGGLV